MYHAIILGDAIELATLARAVGFDLSTDVRELLTRMAQVLRLLSRPDDTLHMFNDCVNGEAELPTEILGRLTRLFPTGSIEPRREWALPDAGYWGVTRADGTRLVVDCGIPGPPWQPGHAHCDMLSFELDVKGQPVVVDSGVAGYGGHPLREYARSTRAHNTLSVDGLEQSEVWSTFRMGRPAEPVDPRASSDGELWRFDGGCRHFHDRAIIHHRTIEMGRSCLTLGDRVEGAEGRLVTKWLHLHPGLVPRYVDGCWVAEGGGLRIRITFQGPESVLLSSGVEGRVPQGWYSPRFGAVLPAPVFEASAPRYDGRILTTRLDWVA